VCREPSPALAYLPFRACRRERVSLDLWPPWPALVLPPTAFSSPQTIARRARAAYTCPDCSRLLRARPLTPGP
jgi:hypothetical protein